MAGGGGKTSITTSNTSSPYAPLLAKFGKSALPLYQQLNSQIGEALRTGGVNAQIPIINRSVDAAREASSTSTEATRQALARAGLSNSSFGTETLAEMGERDASRIADIPASATSAFIGMAPGQINTGVGALGTAAGLTTNNVGTYTPSFWELFLQGANAGGKAASGTNFAAV